MGACPIHDVKYLLSTELQIGQFRVLLQDSDLRRTETILAQPLAEQIEWYRWRGGQGRAWPSMWMQCYGRLADIGNGWSSHARDHPRDAE
jgi:hypothetical protein